MYIVNLQQLFTCLRAIHMHASEKWGGACIAQLRMCITGSANSGSKLERMSQTIPLAIFAGFLKLLLMCGGTIFILLHVAVTIITHPFSAFKKTRRDSK